MSLVRHRRLAETKNNAGRIAQCRQQMRGIGKVTSKHSNLPTSSNRRVSHRVARNVRSWHEAEGRVGHRSAMREEGHYAVTFNLQVNVVGMLKPGVMLRLALTVCRFFRCRSVFRELLLDCKPSWTVADGRL